MHLRTESFVIWFLFLVLTVQGAQNTCIPLVLQLWRSYIFNHRSFVLSYLEFETLFGASYPRLAAILFCGKAALKQICSLVLIYHGIDLKQSNPCLSLTAHFHDLSVSNFDFMRTTNLKTYSAIDHE